MTFDEIMTPCVVGQLKLLNPSERITSPCQMATPPTKSRMTNIMIPNLIITSDTAFIPPEVIRSITNTICSIEPPYINFGYFFPHNSPFNRFL